MLTALAHPVRQREVAALGRRAASGDQAAQAELAALAADEAPWSRWLAAIGFAAGGDREALAAATRDPSRPVRQRAWGLLIRAGDDQALATTLERIADSRLGPRMAMRALERGALPAVETLVVCQAGPDAADWLDVLPVCSETVVAPRMALLDEHGGPKAWARLARWHPRLVADHLSAALGEREVLDPRLRWRITAVLDSLVKADPDAALDVVEALFKVEGQAHAIRSALQRLANRRPTRTFDLVRARQALGLPAPLSGLFALLRFRNPHRLGLERLRFAVSKAPACLPESDEGRRWYGHLEEADQRALVAHWLAHGTGSWGAFLFAQVAAGPERDRAWLRWRLAAESKDGVVPLACLHDLPFELRQAEARRHLTEIPYLQSRPTERRVYASLLPWAEAEAALKAWVTHPEGEERAAALRLWIGAVRHDRAAGPLALAAVRKRKNEQDPVRLAMLEALAAVGSARIPDASLPEVEAVVGEALDAADLSPTTARAAQRLSALLLERAPEVGMALLARVFQVRGTLDGHAIGARIRPEGARRLDPVLAGLIDTWVQRERAGAVVSLCAGLGVRLRQMPATLAALDGLCESPHLGVLAALLALLRTYDRPRFVLRALALFAADPSSACLPDIARLLATSRTDLLDPLLEARPMKGRFATGRSHWVLDFGLQLRGWTPAQQERYAASLVGILDDPERDVPTCRWAIERLAVLCWTSGEPLRRYSADPRIPVRDIAIRALPSLDGTAGLEALLDCMGDDRARIATYALRRALAELPRAEIVATLKAVPMGRVTVAKEVLRMLGELGGPEVRDHLVAIGRSELHRDVRIALLRSLWDHIEHPPAWALLEDAAADPDPILVGRLLSIPMGRLSAQADTRLAALFGEVLGRQEPEARLGFLGVVGLAPLRDGERVLFGRLLGHLATPDPAESAAALRAVFQRMQPGEVPAVVARIASLLPRRRHAHALLTALADTLHFWSPEAQRGVADALIPVLLADRVAGVHCVRLMARTRKAPGLADGLVQLSLRGHLHHDVVAEAISLVSGISHPGQLAVTLGGHEEPRLRRVALAALVVAASPENGWNSARRELLAKFQADPDVEVAGAAAWVFPPHHNTGTP